MNSTSESRLTVTSEPDCPLSASATGFQPGFGHVTHEFLDPFPLEPGQSRSTRVTVNHNGFRYRCPINPTTWYDVGVGG